MKIARLSDINDEPEREALQDMLEHGIGVMQDGKHVPLEDFYSSFGARLESILRQHFGAYASPSKIQAAIDDIEDLRRKHGK